MTLGKVAKHAGVAVDTARKVLREDPSVRFYLRERVLKAAHELDYQPNLVARALRDKSLRLVPISVLELNQLYFGGLASHLSRSLVEIGMEPALCFNPEHLMRMSRSLSTSASILATGFDEATIRALCKRQKVVTVDSNLRGMPAVGNVEIDFVEAYGHVVRTLVAHGRRRIAISSSHFHLSRAKGWKETKFGPVLTYLREMGVGPAGSAEHGVFASSSVLAAWMHEHPGAVDAVLCENDVEAAHLIGELAARRLRTPDDVLVVGCDANCMLRGMWSLKLDTAWLAAEAVRLLQRLLDGETEVAPVVYRPVLVDDAGREVAERPTPDAQRPTYTAQLATYNAQLAAPSQRQAARL
jgi:LacI family transcriptional regulator